MLAIWVHISMSIRCLTKCLLNEDIQKNNHFICHTPESQLLSRKMFSTKNVLRQNNFYVDTNTVQVLKACIDQPHRIDN